MTVTFPFRDEGPVEHDGELPGLADLVVIGGGVIGVSTALYAARAGLSVVLLEKGRVAAEQSSRNWGWIRVQGRDLAEIPVALEAQKLWTALDAECDGRLGVRTVGVSYLARTDKDIAGYADWLAQAKPLGVSSRLLDADETQALLGAGAGRWVGALHTPTDMKAEPWVAVPELARLAVREGAMVRERCAVRGLDMAGGEVSGVITERGRIATGQVVLAGGAWSSLFLRRHGVRIPQLSVRSTAMATAPLPQAVNSAGVDSDFAFRPRADGGYTLAPSAASELFVGPDSFRALGTYLPLAVSGEFDIRLRALAPRGYPDAWGTPRRWNDDDETPFERMRILSPDPNKGLVAATRRNFGSQFPQMGEVPLQAAWAGMIDVLPDVVPVVDRVPQIPGLTVLTGMCGHGFGIGPAFGRIAADMVMGRDPGHDLSRFRISRFWDGTKLVTGPNL